MEKAQQRSWLLRCRQPPRRTISSTAAAIVRARIMPRQEDEVTKVEQSPVSTSVTEENENANARGDEDARVRLRERRKRARIRKKEQKAKAKRAPMEVDVAPLAIADQEPPESAKAIKTSAGKGSSSSGSVAPPADSRAAKVPRTGYSSTTALAAELAKLREDFSYGEKMMKSMPHAIDKQKFYDMKVRIQVLEAQLE